MIEKIGIIGAGITGRELAFKCAIAGFRVIISDVNDEALHQASRYFDNSLDRLRKQEELEMEPEEVRSRISSTTRLEEMADADYVIECVKDRAEVKKQVLSKIGKIVRKDCVIATSTAYQSVSDLSSSVPHSQRFIGLHFPFRPSASPIAEVILGEKTNENAATETRQLLGAIGGDSILVRKDVPGFVIGRINERVFMEAILCAEEGHAMQDIDAMMKFRLNFPLGIFETMDQIGLDVVYNASREMGRRGLNSIQPETLKKLVEEESLGVKTGSGFYEYTSAGGFPKRGITPSEGMYRVNPMVILSAAVNEGSWLVRNDVVSVEDVQKAMILGMNWPEGPLTFADLYGLGNITHYLNTRWSESSNSRYRPDDLLAKMHSEGHNGKSSGKGFLKWKYEELDFGPVHYEKRNDYAVITLSRPGKLNALDEESWSGIRIALARAENDDDIRGIVLTGAKSVYSSGNDLSMMAEWKSPLGAKSWLEGVASPAIEAMLGFSKPIISAVEGYALGGGCELAILSDIVIASDDAVFSIPEGLIGAIPPIATSYGFGILNKQLARYALTGERMSAREARNLGIVDVVADSEQIPLIIAEFAEKIRRVAPLSSRAMKSVLNASRQVFSSQAALAAENFALLAASSDFAEGLISAIGKKKPKWSGK